MCYEGLLTVLFLRENLKLEKEVELEPSPRGILREKCHENMQKIYSRTPMGKCDFKGGKQLYSNHTSTWVFSCKFAAHLQNTFS